MQKGKELKARNIAYIPINDPLFMRRHIILSMIDIVKLLENYENYKKIKKQKRHLISQLREKLNELEAHSEHFRLLFPEVKQKELKEEKKKIEEKEESLKPKRTESFKHLDKELQELNERLKDISF
jgi:septin family protein